MPSALSPRRLAALVAAAALSACADAYALAGDRYFVTLGSGITYDDNLYRLPGGVNPPASTGSTARTDLITSLTLRGQADLRIGRQRLRADAAAVASRYAEHDTLDNRGGNVGLTWDWQASSWWSGSAFYTRNRSLASFVDLRSFEKNTIDVTNYGINGEHWLLPQWRAFAGLGFVRVDNSAASLVAASADNRSYSAGLRWLTGRESSVRFGLTYTDGRSPNLQVFPGATVDNRFSQTDLGVDVLWRVSGLSDLSARLAYTERRHPQVGLRDFSGLTGRVQWDYRWSGKTGVLALARREIGAVTDLVANYVVTEAVSVAPYVLLTAKTRVDVALERQNREFAGDPGIVINRVGAREDRLSIVSLNLRYQPSRTVTITGSYAHSTRSSNRSGFDFRGNAIGISVQATW